MPTSRAFDKLGNPRSPAGCGRGGPPRPGASPGAPDSRASPPRSSSGSTPIRAGPGLGGSLSAQVTRALNQATGAGPRPGGDFRCVRWSGRVRRRSTASGHSAWRSPSRPPRPVAASSSCRSMSLPPDQRVSRQRGDDHATGPPLRLDALQPLSVQSEPGRHRGVQEHHPGPGRRLGRRSSPAPTCPGRRGYGCCSAACSAWPSPPTIARPPSPYRRHADRRSGCAYLPPQAWPAAGPVRVLDEQQALRECSARMA